MNHVRIAMIVALMGVLTASTAHAAGSEVGLPFPGTLVLLVSGIGGLAGLAWWRNRK